MKHTVSIIIILLVILILSIYYIRHTCSYSDIYKYTPGRIDDHARGDEEMKYPVDVVYTWVDGGDRNWKKIKDSYRDMYDNGVRNIRDINSNSDNRWQDFDTLKYSLICLHRYAPWVRNIFIITMNQRPSWYRSDYMSEYMQKVVFVDHADVIPSKYLPTFNSVAIETFLHEITNLSEYYLYLNDDMFIGAPSRKEDFFLVKDGVVKIKVFLEPGSCADRETYSVPNNLLDKIKYEEFRACSAHAPRSRSRELDRKRLAQFDQYVEYDRQSKFRNKLLFHDVYIFSHYWYFYNGYGVRVQIENFLCGITDDLNLNERCLKELLRLRPLTFTINDHVSWNGDKVRDLVAMYLDKY